MSQKKLKKKQVLQSRVGILYFFSSFYNYFFQLSLLLIFSAFFNILSLVSVILIGIRPLFAPPLHNTLIIFFIYFGTVCENLTQVLVLNPPKDFQSSDGTSQDERDRRKTDHLQLGESEKEQP